MGKNSIKSLEKGCFYLGFNGDILYSPIHPIKEESELVSYINGTIPLPSDGRYLGEKLIKLNNPFELEKNNYKKLEWIEKRLKEDRNF